VHNAVIGAANGGTWMPWNPFDWLEATHKMMAYLFLHETKRLDYTATAPLDTAKFVTQLTLDFR